MEITSGSPLVLTSVYCNVRVTERGLSDGTIAKRGLSDDDKTKRGLSDVISILLFDGASLMMMDLL